MKIKNLIFTLLFIPMLFASTGFLTVNYSLAEVQKEPAAVNISTTTLENPLKNINSIEGLLVAILNVLMVIMVPVIVFFIIYSGFKYVMAQGNASQVEEATRSLTYAILGAVLILGALAIAEIIKNIVQAFAS